MGSLVHLGRLVAESMNASMDIRVMVLVEIFEGVDDLARFLGRGRIIEVDKTMAVDLSGEYREFGGN